MHICLDFVPQLLNQPHLEKQVRIQPTGKKRLLAHTSKFKPDISIIVSIYKFLDIGLLFFKLLETIETSAAKSRLLTYSKSEN